MLAGVTDWGKSRKWGCRGRLALGFKPRHGSHARGDHAALGCSLLPHGLGSRRDLAGKKRGEKTLAGGLWEGATWFWINWRLLRWHTWWCWEPQEVGQPSMDCWEPRGYLSHGLLFLSLIYGTVDWAEGEGRAVYVCGYSKGLWHLNEDIKSLLLSLYNFWINNSFPFHESLALRDVIPWWLPGQT